MKKILQRSLFATVSIGIVFPAFPGFATGSSAGQSIEAKAAANSSNGVENAVILLKDLEDLYNKLKGKKKKEKTEKLLSLIKEFIGEAKAYHHRQMMLTGNIKLQLSKSRGSKAETDKRSIAGDDQTRRKNPGPAFSKTRAISKPCKNDRRAKYKRGKNC